MTRVVLVSPSGSAIGSLKDLNLDSPASVAEHTVVVLTWAAVPAPPHVRVLAVGADRLGTVVDRIRTVLSRALSGSAAGRNFLRLTPFDGGRRMWRAVRHRPEAVVELRRAELIVAIDRDGILTSWKSVHSALAPRSAAVYGVPAARASLDTAKKTD